MSQTVQMLPFQRRKRCQTTKETVKLCFYGRKFIVSSSETVSELYRRLAHLWVYPVYSGTSPGGFSHLWPNRAEALIVGCFWWCCNAFRAFSVSWCFTSSLNNFDISWRFTNCHSIIYMFHRVSGVSQLPIETIHCFMVFHNF